MAHSEKGTEFSLMNAIAGSYLAELAYRMKAVVIQTAEQVLFQGFHLENHTSPGN